MRVLIPRGGSWGDEVSRLVTEAGFEPLVLPLVRIEPAEDQEHLQQRMRQLAEGGFDWLVVTSQSTVRVLPGVPAAVSVAAVGAVTAAALRERGIPVAFIPTRQSAAGLVDEWPIRSGRVLWPHALDARPTIAEGLRRHGMQVADVVAYRAVPVFDSGHELAEAVLEQTGAISWSDSEPQRHQSQRQVAWGQGQQQSAGDDDAVLTAMEPAETPVDAVLVTSGSVAKQLARLGLPAGTTIVAMGEQTAEDCRKHGLTVDAIAQQPSGSGLVKALLGTL